MYILASAKNRQSDVERYQSQSKPDIFHSLPLHTCTLFVFLFPFIA